MLDSIFAKIVVGTAQFGMDYGIANNNGQIDEVEAKSILEFAYGVGINTLDTAKRYGRSEETIGYYLREHTGEDWHIITKVNSKANNVEVQVTQSIDKLSVTPEIVLAHCAADYFNPSFCNELHQLKETKGVKQVGVSVYTSDEIQKILSGTRPDVIQCPLNILDTRLYRNSVLDEIKGEGIDIHIRSVFLQGLFYLSDDKLKQHFSDVMPTIRRLKMLSQEASQTLAELSLLWVCSLKYVDKVIIGVDNLEQLKAHVHTIKKNVDPAVFEEALTIKYENENILNPSLWSSRS